MMKATECNNTNNRTLSIKFVQTIEENKNK